MSCWRQIAYLIHTRTLTRVTLVPPCLHRLHLHLLADERLGGGFFLVLGGVDGDHVGDGGLGAGAPLGVPLKHDFHLDADAPLAEQHVTHGGFDVLAHGVSGRDHVAVLELHGLPTLATQLAGHDHLATLGAVLHDEAQHAVARTAHGEAAEQLVAEGLSLGDGAQTTVGHLLGVELHGALGEAEPLLHQRGQLADAAALLA
mmetsp:Transcript_421/g.993  ORF Transcript_421/g.993 Transcript_421/m.993 type:complete len:202 (+) Transcript_421:20-625(+)